MRRPSSRLRERSATGAICGVEARSDRSSESPALMPPTRGSTSNSSTSAPNRSRMRRPSESWAVGRAGRTTSSAARTLPGQESRRERASPPIPAGTPRTRPSGMSCKRPRWATNALPVAGETRSVRPSSASRAVPHGTRARMASGPLSSPSIPAKREACSLPPRGPGSKTVTVWRACTRRYAAVRPVMPPPTTAIERGSLVLMRAPPPVRRVRRVPADHR